MRLSLRVTALSAGGGSRRMEGRAAPCSSTLFLVIRDGLFTSETLASERYQPVSGTAKATNPQLLAATLAGMERRVLILAAAAIPLGLAGGYAWSTMNAAGHRAAPPKATMTEIFPSPEELPEVADAEWTNRADDNQVAPEDACPEGDDDGFDCAAQPAR